MLVRTHIQELWLTSDSFLGRWPGEKISLHTHFLCLNFPLHPGPCRSASYQLFFQHQLKSALKRLFNFGLDWFPPTFHQNRLTKPRGYRRKLGKITTQVVTLTFCHSGLEFDPLPPPSLTHVCSCRQLPDEWCVTPPKQWKQCVYLARRDLLPTHSQNCLN